MFCPLCKAEYREGFTRCSSCDALLVDFLPQNDAGPSSPDRDPNHAHFLAYFLPMMTFYVLTLVLFAFPKAINNVFVLAPTLILYLVSPFGTLWMLYQSARYEEKPVRYILLAMVPFMFVWYYMSRYHTGRMERVPIALRRGTSNL
jgi:uncharacterized membrane protein